MAKTIRSILLILPAALIALSGCGKSTSSAKATGGFKLTLQAMPGTLSVDSLERDSQMDKTLDVLRVRIFTVPSVKEPRVERKDKDKFVVTLPGAKDKAESLSCLTKNAEFRIYYLADVRSSANPGAKWQLMPYETDPKTGADVYSFKNTLSKEILRSNTPEGEQKIMRRVINAYDPKTNPGGISPVINEYNLEREVEVSSGRSGGCNIRLELNHNGEEAFERFTKYNVNSAIAMVVDGKLVSVPTITEPVHGDDLEVHIGNSVDKANRWAQLLNAGPLPVPLKAVSVDKL